MKIRPELGNITTEEESIKGQKNKQTEKRAYEKNENKMYNSEQK